MQNVIVETRNGNVVSVSNPRPSLNKAIEDAADFAADCGQNREEALCQLKERKYCEDGEVRLTIIRQG